MAGNIRTPLRMDREAEPFTHEPYRVWTCTQIVDSRQRTGHTGRARRHHGPSTHCPRAGTRTGTGNVRHRPAGTYHRLLLREIAILRDALRIVAS